MKKPLSDHLRLEHMLDAANQISQAYQTLPHGALPDGDYRFFAFVKLTEIIGEAASKLTLEFRRQHPAVEWQKIIGLRHVLVHNYDTIDEKALWQIIR
ncbi:DUF86 domain-containing protein [Hymenobacter sp. BT175]|uniref:HepT-like ribonuclease domain-containing protein n=1 Tax=Hymenobacter translucens TaxID=2886507 RepID=UPI001D0DD3E8|nr:HepT-like ribonuclease domain-containing protein [Hymenobacter translucens]MCC2547568.1 DUF86 domain-containing protein [Hymenobacter translucens]